MPGISDHDIVFAEMDIRPEKHIQKPRLIPPYKKANWGEIKEDMKALNESITSLYSSDTTDVNTMWEHFKDTLQTSLKSHIPHRRAKTKDGYPWIGPELKKLIRKQHRLYKLKKNRRSDPQAEIPGDQAPSTEAYPTSLLGICREHSYATEKGDLKH